MKRLLLVFITLQLFSPYGVAENERKLCGEPVALVDPLTLDAIEQALVSADSPAEVFKRLAEAYENTLPPSEPARSEADRFLARLRNADETAPAVWDISRIDADTDMLFKSFPDEAVSFDCTQAIAPYQKNMAYLAGVVKKLLQPSAAAEARPILDVILSRSRQAENLLNNGLPMWPWENYVNGRRLGISDAEPLFTTQWIVMRPSAALQFNTRNRAEANLNASLVIEPIGFVRYTDRTYKSWWGASAVVSVSSDAGMGYGALLRYDKYTLGLTLHKSASPNKDDDVFLLLGVDLYDYLNNKRQQLPFLGPD
ncbi:MAG: hypothetical protein OEZ08_17180 [Betaproteobacteria bacterium]|nr:hypothetical protein [Betaproteobacteria bacterium]